MREPCRDPDHGPTCEGSALHIRARDKNGCAQFQDGSWFTKDRNVCPGPHPESLEGITQADVVRAMIERVR